MSQPAKRPSAFRALLRGTALYSLAMFGQRLATTFLLLPINARLLTRSDFGVLSLIEQIVILMSVVPGSQITALGYFYFEKDNQKERDGVASTALIGSALAGALAGLAGLALVEPAMKFLFVGQEGARLSLIICMVCFGFHFVVEAGLGWVRIVDRPVIYGIATMLRVSVAIIATLLFVAQFRFGLLGIILASNLAIVSTALFVAVYFFRSVPMVCDRRLFFRMVRFALPIAAGSIAMLIVHFGDRFILPRYRSFAELGVYGVAYKIGMTISMIYEAFHVYWAPRVVEFVRRDDAQIFITRVATYLILVLSFCALGLLVFCHPAVEILTTKKFEEAAAVAPIIIGAYYIRSISEFFRCFFLAAGKPLYESICNWIGAAICVAGYFLLIPPYGMWGAAWATAFTFGVMGVIVITWTTRLRPYRWEIGRIVKIVAAFCGLGALQLLLPVRPLAEEILRGVLIVAAFPVLIWLLQVPLPGEVERARTLTGGLIRRIRAQVAAAGAA